ncbi:vanadium-dependent haloperoxidase [Foetidibacter luteolus]|uniref:vanadium-dependent haloperoxidase n=1 Tax=Foetidibacter luteolus TaxID=2608880 RepID=UPI00129A5CA9|nr:vanadium-dependent haloperoxidase [Foetidibacter luteolus]
MKHAVLISLFVVTGFFYGHSQDWKAKSGKADYLHRTIKKVTDIMVFDIYSPPVASRTYAYISIAGYEAAIQGNTGSISLAGQLHQLKPVPVPEADKELSNTAAAVFAICNTAKALVISEEKVDAFLKEVLQEFKNDGVPDEVIANSQAYGKLVAAHILAWAAGDNYKQTRSLPKYMVSEEPSTWKPTPPAYIKAIEPHWNKIRTFIIDSAEQFKPIPPPAFSTKKESRFYKEAMAVRNVGLKLTREQNEIANFWDCNPFKMNVRGHVMFATKKISPGGHWVNITAEACQKVNADVIKSAEAYACLAIALADGFISCWTEKYRSNVIRPETYINQYIDPNWLPLLQTPPFPEYTSGHSVVSGAAAVVLTKIFGDNFSYTDSTEVEFELPPRTFTSFKQAAQEAAISRFYGGIHYMPAIDNGLKEGSDLGLFIVRKIKTRKQG